MSEQTAITRRVRRERLRTIRAVVALMRSAGLPWDEMDDDALVPIGNQGSLWFVGKDQVGSKALGTAPLTDEAILERVERCIARGGRR